MTVVKTEKQYGVVTDLLSAGEIEGIVDGLAGVYLNNTALLDSSTYNNNSYKVGTAKVTGNLITDAGNLFADLDLSSGDYYIQIYGAQLAGTITSVAPLAVDGVGQTINSFTSSYRSNVLNGRPTQLDDPLKNLVRVIGGDESGTDWSGVLLDQLYPPPPNSLTGKSVVVDFIGKVSSKVSDSSVVLDASVNVGQPTNVYVKLSQPISVLKSTDLNEDLAYDNTFAVFRSGKVDQPPITEVVGVPSASYLIAPNFELKWHDSCSGVDQEDIATAGTQATKYITAGEFNFGQNAAKEIDKIKINVEFPAGLRHNGREGEERDTYAEFQITFDPGITPTQEYLVTGRNYGGADFTSSIPSWDAGNINTAKNFYKYPDGTRYNRGVVHRKGNATKFIAEFEINIASLNIAELGSNWRVGIKRLSPETLNKYALDDNNFQGLCVIRTVEAIFLDKLTYPNSAYVVTGFSAEDFPTPPNRSYLVRGRKVKVPTNYFTREETGSNSALYTRNITTGFDTGSYQDWDGTFRGDKSLGGSNPNFYKVYTNNPAWIFYDLLVDKEIGLGEYINEEDVDVYALYQIARYCDELVADGEGGTEPRFTCNVYLQGQQEAYKVLKDFASVFRGMMYWIDGKITAVQDRPKEPVYTFNKANVSEGSFSYTYTGQKARVNQVNVTWNNPEELYKQTVLTLDDVPNIAKQGRIIKKDLVAFACTSESQARRLGKWSLSTDINETELVSFSTSINAGFLRPGDLINVADSDELNTIFSGRTVVGSTQNLIQIDRTIDLLSSEEYFLYLIFPEPGIYLAQTSANINGVDYFRGALLTEDNLGNPISSQTDAANLTDASGNNVATQFSKNTRIETQQISTGATSGTEIAVVANYSSSAEKDVIWAIKSSSSTYADLKPYRILAIEETEEVYNITAAAYYSLKFDEIDIEKRAPQVSYISVSGRRDKVPSPGNVAVELVPSGANSGTGGTNSFDGVISWESPTETFRDTNGTDITVPYRYLSAFELQHSFSTPNSNTGFTTVNVPANATSFTVSNASGGNNTIRVRTINDLGIKSSWSYVSKNLFSAAGSVGGILGGLAKGGVLTSSQTFSTLTGKVFLNEKNYLFTPPSKEDYSVLNATTNQSEQSLAIPEFVPTLVTNSTGTTQVTLDKLWPAGVSESYYCLKGKVFSNSDNSEVLDLTSLTDVSNPLLAEAANGLFGIVRDSIAVALDTANMAIKTYDIVSGSLLDTYIATTNSVAWNMTSESFCKDGYAVINFREWQRDSPYNPFGVLVPASVGTSVFGSGYTTASFVFSPNTTGLAATATIQSGQVIGGTVTQYGNPLPGGGLPLVAVAGDGVGAIASAGLSDKTKGSVFVFEIAENGGISVHSQYSNLQAPGFNSNTLDSHAIYAASRNIQKGVALDTINSKIHVAYSPGYPEVNWAEPLDSLSGGHLVSSWNFTTGFHGWQAGNENEHTFGNYTFFGTTSYIPKSATVLAYEASTPGGNIRIKSIDADEGILGICWGNTVTPDSYIYEFYEGANYGVATDNASSTKSVSSSGGLASLAINSQARVAALYNTEVDTVSFIDFDSGNTEYTNIVSGGPTGYSSAVYWSDNGEKLIQTTNQDGGGVDGRAHVYSFETISGKEIYWLYDKSTRDSDPWKAVYLRVDTNVKDLSGDPVSFSYWTEAQTDRLLDITGTVSTTQGSATVTGVGTTFTADFVEGSFIRVSSTTGAIEPVDSEYRFVSQVLSDTSLSVNTPFLRTRSGQNAQKPSFLVDVAGDALLAKVSKDINGAYVYDPFIVTKESSAKAIGYDATDFSIEYDSSSSNPQFNGADTVSPAGAATDIRLFANSSGFASAEYEFSIGGIVVQAFSSADFYDYTVPTTKAVNSIKVDITGREASLPEATASNSFNISNSITGAEGVTATISATDTSIDYDASNQNPTFTGADTESPAGLATDIRLSASIISGTVTSPEYQFYIDGTIVQAFSSADFYDYTVPTTKSISGVTGFVEIRPSGSTNVSASSTVQITFLTAGATQYTNSDVDTHLNTGTAGASEVLSWTGSDYDWIAAAAGYTNSNVDTHLNTGTAGASEVLSWTGSDYDWVAPATGGAPTINTTTNTAVNPVSTLDVVGTTYSSLGDSHTWTSSGGTTMIIVDQSYSIDGGGQSTSTGRWRIQDITGTPVTIFDPFDGVAFSGVNAEFPNGWFGTECHNFLYTPASGSRTIELQWNTNDGQATLRRLEWTTIEY